MAGDVHVIRLTAAWERSEQGDWLRQFGCPAGLDGSQRLSLVVVGSAQTPPLRLNGTPLGPPIMREPGRWAWEVTSLLVPRNRLEWPADADLGPPPATGRGPLPTSFGEVQLEIVEGMAVNNA